MARVVSMKKDSRISKTDWDIKRAMLELIRKEEFSQIRIEQIMQEAPVTKVAFYKHFASSLAEFIVRIILDKPDFRFIRFETQADLKQVTMIWGI